MKPSQGYHSSRGDRAITLGSSGLVEVSGAGRIENSDVAGAASLRGPDPMRLLDHETSHIGALPPSPASIFREIPEATWCRVEAITARAPENLPLSRPSTAAASAPPPSP